MALFFLILFLMANVCMSEKMGVFELKRGDFSVNITNYGATVLSVVVPDRNGKLDDIVLGYESLDQYKNDSTYFGAIVGRVANRIGGAQFTLNGKHYKLVANDNGNTLHGGNPGFSDVVWKVVKHKKDRHLILSYNSYDGEQGFPGALRVTVTYVLIGENKLGIKMEGHPVNKATPVNLASHTYWNLGLGGHSSGTVLSHTIALHASKFTPVNDKLIPTGLLSSVKGTPYDFRVGRTIGSRLKEVGPGYDINYAVQNQVRKVAIVKERKSGRKMELWSNQVGVQFYTGNMLSDEVGKGGVVYGAHDGFCLETQGYPDSVNHPNFPSQIVNPGDKYLHLMLYRFTAS